MNPFTKEPCVFKTKPPNKAVRVLPMRMKMGWNCAEWIGGMGSGQNEQEAQQHSTRINLLWILLRLHASLVEQDVPGWAGFVSLTGEKPERKTTIDYYPVIFNPITEYKTVQECLRQAECATNEVGQEYVITTFDLGVCMKAYPLIWNQPQRFEKHIVLIGTFHLVCAYLKMIGKKMNGSGLSDVLLEADLITSGSLKGVESGKQYDRALHCHKSMLSRRLT